ncbi:hypothetical protein ACFPIJ_26040 [Dactylosporangium cerinum]|uniref:Uncharacterized protein n=1 Tax=Dactylosporangium cerinum TaxID=1434730 RepID=A0ABV9VZV8_9ACTN
MLALLQLGQEQGPRPIAPFRLLAERVQVLVGGPLLTPRTVGRTLESLAKRGLVKVHPGKPAGPNTKVRKATIVELVHAL